MRVGSVALAYHEERFIRPHLQHMPAWVEQKVVLVSEKPWQGPAILNPDLTGAIARKFGADVFIHPWATEEEQRNAGQDILSDMDWILVLDPDEFLSDQAWSDLWGFLESAQGEAYVCQAQNTYWKSGYVIRPQEGYRQIIAVKPWVKFVDKRVVDSRWGITPVQVEHMSWARTDAEVMKKITHYSHAHELIPNWYRRVWKTNRLTDLHPLTPKDLAQAVPAELPPELEGLNLWPSD